MMDEIIKEAIEHTATDLVSHIVEKGFAALTLEHAKAEISRVVEMALDLNAKEPSATE